MSRLDISKVSFLLQRNYPENLKFPVIDVAYYRIYRVVTFDVIGFELDKVWFEVRTIIKFFYERLRIINKFLLSLR